jgi:hypothetical protein
MRIRIVSTAVAAAGPGTSTETLLSTEVDGDNCNALSAIRMMLDQSGGAVHSERRVNAGTTVELWLPEAFPGRRDRSFGPGYALPELHD